MFSEKVSSARLLISLLCLPQNNNRLSFQHSLERVNEFLNTIYRKIKLGQLNEVTYWNYYNFFIKKNVIGKYGHIMSKFSVILSINLLTFSQGGNSGLQDFERLHETSRASNDFIILSWDYKRLRRTSLYFKTVSRLQKTLWDFKGLHKISETLSDFKHEVLVVSPLHFL